MDFLLKSIASLLFQVVEIRLPTPVLADSGSKSFLVNLSHCGGTPVVEGKVDAGWIGVKEVSDYVTLWSTIVCVD